MYPEDLKYTREHEWARIEGDRATIGITDYAQEALGDIVYVDIPPAGTAVTAGERFGEVSRPNPSLTSTAPYRGRSWTATTSSTRTPRSSTPTHTGAAGWWWSRWPAQGGPKGSWMRRLTVSWYPRADHAALRSRQSRRSWARPR